MYKKAGTASLALAFLLSAGVAFAQTAPSGANPFGVSVSLPQSILAGKTNTAIGLITLDASHSSVPVKVVSIPFTLTLDHVAQGAFSNCTLRGTNNIQVPLNTGTNVLGSIMPDAPSTIMLDRPLVIPAGSTAQLVLACDIIPAIPVGSTVSLAINSSSSMCMNADTGAPIQPTVGPAGTTSIGTPTSSNAPGIPNTGAGGASGLNFAILAISGFVALLGAGILARKSA